MQLPDLDLRLLQAFLVLMQERNIRKASENLGISQAAMSRGLAKLRRAFNDPLFIPTTRGMEPTPRATGAYLPITQLVELASRQFAPISPFDPKIDERLFSIAASDVGELLFIPTLVKLCADLPCVRFHASRLSIKELPEELKSGAVDVAVGSFPALETGIRCRRLFAERYICLVREGHPSISGSLTLEQFRSARQHIVVAAKILGHAQTSMERALLELLPQSAVKVTSSSFLLSALVASETDCILIAPSTLASTMREHGRFQVLPCPIESDSFDIQLYWHERSHDDPAHQWLRNLMVQHFSDDRRSA